MLPTTVSANVIVEGVAEITGPGAVPTPLSETLMFPAPLLMASVPVRLPATVGMKTTFRVHEAFAARLDPQLLVCEKSPSPPLVEIELIGAALVPELVTVTARGELLTPTGCEPKLTADGFASNPPTAGGKIGVGGVPLHKVELIQLSLPPLLTTLN